MSERDRSYRESAEIGPEQLEAMVRRAGERAARGHGLVTGVLAVLGLLGGVALALERLNGSAVLPGLLFLGMLGGGFGVLASQWLQPVVLSRLLEGAARAEAKREGVPAAPVIRSARATFL
ncbi:MAG: hypothetical protein AB8I08_02850 [Sandaracinaceae bacterium]